MTILIEALSTPGCTKCAASQEALKAVVVELGADRISWREVNVLDEIDRAVELGVLTPPAIAIDGELVFPALPSADRLRAELLKRLTKSA